MRSGIYFILKRKKIIYVGQTKRFPFRFNQSAHSFEFDSIRFIECDPDHLLEYERRWIKRFDPIRNTMCRVSNPRIGKPNPNAGRLVGSSYFDYLQVGEYEAYYGKYSPSVAIRYFNKTRQRKLEYFRKDGQTYIKRVA